MNDAEVFIIVSNGQGLSPMKSHLVTLVTSWKQINCFSVWPVLDHWTVLSQGGIAVTAEG